MHPLNCRNTVDSSSNIQYLRHARNAPWALSCIQEHSRRNYSNMESWMNQSHHSQPTMPGERVWEVSRYDSGLDFRYGVDYFTSHASEGRGPCPQSRAELHSSQFSEDKQDKKSSTMCLCRLGVICLARRPSGYTMGREEDPLVTAMLFQNTCNGHCVDHWHLPTTVDWRQEGPLDPFKWGFRFLEHVMYCTLRHVALEWVKLIQNSEMHVACLVSHNAPVRTPLLHYRHCLTSQRLR